MKIIDKNEAHPVLPLMQLSLERSREAFALNGEHRLAALKWMLEDLDSLEEEDEKEGRHADVTA